MLKTQKYNWKQDFKWRLIKIQDNKGHWHNYFNINHAKFLKIKEKHQPLHCYWSVSRWLNFKEQNNYKLSERLFIDSDLWVEVDAKVFETYSIPRAQLEIRRINRYLIYHFGNHLEFKDFVFSGGGFYANYKIKVCKELKDPIERFKQYEEIKKYYIELLIAEGFLIDYKAMLDMYRVKRIPDTINSKYE